MKPLFSLLMEKSSGLSLVRTLESELRENSSHLVTLALSSTTRGIAMPFSSGQEMAMCYATQVVWHPIAITSSQRERVSSAL